MSVDVELTPQRRGRAERFLATVAPFPDIVFVSHVNPDPDALASMLGLQALIDATLPGKRITLTMDGMIARAENQAMVDLIPVPLIPVGQVPITAQTALVMVDTQPHTGRRASEAATPLVVLDHHETGGLLDGVVFRDIRPQMGATSTIVTGYLLESNIPVAPRLATALLYGIESEVAGFPREAGPADDGALVWLFTRADKDLLAQIKNPKLPQSHFATVQHALANAFIYGNLILSWCGPVSQPDIIAEMADFFIRFEQVQWVVCVGVYDGLLKFSMRVSHLGGHAGEVLRDVVDGLGTAGGHDKRAGGAIPIPDARPETIDPLLKTIRHRLLHELGITEGEGRRLLEASPLLKTP